MAATFKKDLDPIRLRISSIRAARDLEQEEKRKALLATAAAAAKPKTAVSFGAPSKAPAAKAAPAVLAAPLAAPVLAPALPSATASATPSTMLPTVPPTTEPVMDSGDYEKPATMDRARAILQDAQPILDSVERIKASQDPALKKKILDFRMFINRRVGQVSNSAQQVFLVTREFFTLASRVWQEDGQEMLNYVAWVMATKFLEQAETQVSLHAPSAFPLAQVVTEMMVVIPAVKNIFMALLITRCPYIIPRYPPRLPGQSDRDHRASLGYRLLGTGELEAEAAYTERMAGLVVLYAAVIQGQPFKKAAKNPFDLDFAWIWLAALLNMKPRTITPYVVASFLETAGYRMSLKYGANFQGLMGFVMHTFLPMIPSASIGAKTRLKIWVEGVLERGAAEEPEGFRIQGINYNLGPDGAKR